MADIVAFIGALVPTFLIGRLLLWALGKIGSNKIPLAIAANVSALLVAVLILFAGDNIRMLWIYVAAQAVWLALDLFRALRSREP